jgi:chemotaxis protein methyltransferase CheR/type IV pilus assembly protein PilK
MPMREHPHKQAAWHYMPPATMDADLFQQWSVLLEQRAGIALPESRKTFLITNLTIRMRELGIAAFDAYYNLVVSGTQGDLEWQTLVDRLTVHETRFFRDPLALQFIRDVVLPKLLQGNTTPYTANVWSVGCATGEEPYSLAMVLESFFAQQADGYYYGITASDVSRAALDAGRQALYHKHRVKNVPPLLARQYLHAVDTEHVQVSAALRQHVCFVPINIVELDAQPIANMDIIVCQNVFIYFKQALRQQILDRLANHLKPGGILILGPGEVTGWAHAGLTPVNYQSISAFERMPLVTGGA